jgi:hypothetical protein
MHKISLRVSDADFQALEMRATTYGKTVSEVVRQFLRHPPLQIAPHDVATCAEALVQHLDARCAGLQADLHQLAQERHLPVLEVLAHVVERGLLAFAYDGTPPPRQARRTPTPPVQAPDTQ